MVTFQAPRRNNTILTLYFGKKAKRAADIGTIGQLCEFGPSYCSSCLAQLSLIESRVGQGSTFFVTLPIQVSAQAERDPTSLGQIAWPSHPRADRGWPVAACGGSLRSDHHAAGNLPGVAATAVLLVSGNRLAQNRCCSVEDRPNAIEVFRPTPKMPSLTCHSIAKQPGTRAVFGQRQRSIPNGWV